MALDIHFLNVGHGDCTVIDFPSGRLSIIDINNSPGLDESTEDDLAAEFGLNQLQYRLMKMRSEIPYSLGIMLKSLEDRLVDPAKYLAQYYPGRSVFRFILTHPDMDHMSGLYRLFSPHQDDIALSNFWDTDNEKSMSENDFQGSGSKGMWDDWQEYVRLRDPDEAHTVLNNYRNQGGHFWSEDGMSILSPTSELVEQANRSESWNQLSYVLTVEYAGRRVVLGGDADIAAWADIHSHYGDLGLKADILKASHHGRDSGYHQPSVKAIDPVFTVVSVGKKPETDASNKYRHYSDKAVSTRFHGSIRAQILDNGEIWLYDWNNDRIDDRLAPPLV